MSSRNIGGNTESAEHILDDAMPLPRRRRFSPILIKFCQFLDRADLGSHLHDNLGLGPQEPGGSSGDPRPYSEQGE
jgi:hypothetical protein